MERDQFLQEVQEALDVWGDILKISFARVDDRKDVDFTVQFSDQSKENMFLFDGPGGTLAITKNNNVSFDQAERWTLKGMKERLGSFHFFTVAVHEFGHLLG